MVSLPVLTIPKRIGSFLPFKQTSGPPGFSNELGGDLATSFHLSV